MERYRGLLVCTTNRVTDLDDASLRRFGLKVEFGHLERDGVLALYNQLLAPLVDECLTGNEREEIGSAQWLTPGIFRIVRDAVLLGSESFCHGSVIAALIREAVISATGRSTKIGFVR